jgi:hypothetical protein
MDEYGGEWEKFSGKSNFKQTSIEESIKILKVQLARRMTYGH